METNRPILIIANNLTKADLAKIQNFHKSYKNFKFYLAYLVPSIPANFYRIPSMHDISQKLHSECNNKLLNICLTTNFNTAQCFLIKGGIANTFEIAKKLRIQAILTNQPFKFNLLSYLGLGSNIPCMKVNNLDKYQNRLAHKTPSNMQMKIRGA